MAKPSPASERLKRLLEDPNLMDTICTHVAAGGTLIDLCEDTWNVQYGRISNWIHADKERSKRYIQALNDRAEWGTEIVLRELRRLGLSDIRKIFKEDGSLKPVEEWPAEISAAVASIEVDELFEGSGKERQQIGFTKKVKFWDKGRALELLGKNLRLFIERHESANVAKLEDLVMASFKDEKDEPGEQT